MQIRAGETIAIVGPSGSGKTTLVQLLARFYPPSAGEITLDGINIEDYKAKYISNSKLIPYSSPLGHCVANPGNDSEFELVLDKNIHELLQ